MNMYLLNSYYVVSTVVDDGDTALGKAHKVSLLWIRREGGERKKYEKR